LGRVRSILTLALSPGRDEGEGKGERGRLCFGDYKPRHGYLSAYLFFVVKKGEKEKRRGKIPENVVHIENYNMVPIFPLSCSRRREEGEKKKGLSMRGPHLNWGVSLP